MMQPIMRDNIHDNDNLDQSSVLKYNLNASGRSMGCVHVSNCIMGFRSEDNVNGSHTLINHFCFAHRKPRIH